jgi:hypothetical protein
MLVNIFDVSNSKKNACLSQNQLNLAFALGFFFPQKKKKKQEILM